MKVSDYIAQICVNDYQIRAIFAITGGFSMHIGHSISRMASSSSSSLETPIQVSYHHHEQACGYAAVGYTWSSGKYSLVCTTAGIAATNAISPCVVAYQDSVPVLFLTGQANTEETIRYRRNHGQPPLRHYSGADVDIIDMVKGITKFAFEIHDVRQVRPIFQYAFDLMKSGRPGPVWISVPLDLQGRWMSLEEDDFSLSSLICSSPLLEEPTTRSLSTRCKESFVQISEKELQRPVVLIGNGMHGYQKQLQSWLERFPFPVVTSFHGSDCLPTDHPCYVGRVGVIGDRAGNFCLQNASLLLVLGCRLAQGVVGYRPDWFAREALILHVDIDQDELTKSYLSSHPRYERLWMSIEEFWKYWAEWDNSSIHDRIFEQSEFVYWKKKVEEWKVKWWKEQPPLCKEESRLNPYPILKRFFEDGYLYDPMRPKIYTVSSGSIVTVIWHMLHIFHPQDRYLMSSQGDMGFELTSAIGACLAQSSTHAIYCLLGDGALQFNIQELQTIVGNNLPIRILVFNNGGYGANIITQSTYFQHVFGSTPETGVTFPNIEHVCTGYHLPYIKIETWEDWDLDMPQVYTRPTNEGPILVEIMVHVQGRHPRLMAKSTPDGFVNRPFEDMSPFLTEEEMKAELFISRV